MSIQDNLILEFFSYSKVREQITDSHFSIEQRDTIRSLFEYQRFSLKHVFHYIYYFFKYRLYLNELNTSAQQSKLYSIIKYVKDNCTEEAIESKKEIADLIHDGWFLLDTVNERMIMNFLGKKVNVILSSFLLAMVILVPFVTTNPIVIIAFCLGITCILAFRRNKSHSFITCRKKGRV